MTCIVGLEHEERVWMGGDSASIRLDNLDRRLLGNDKIFLTNGILFGSSGSARINQLFHFSLKIPRQKVKDDYQYLCTDFINAARECIRDGGHLKVEECGEEIDGNILVGYRGHLYSIESDYNIRIPDIGFDACGSGENYALGSLFSTQGTKLNPKERLTLALEAAAYFSAGVSPPFSFLVSKKYKQ